MHDEYPRRRYHAGDHVQSLARRWIRRLWLPSILWTALVALVLILLCGWQVVEFWNQNLAIQRPPSSAPLRALPLVLRTFAVDVPRELLTRRELEPGAGRLATAEIFVPAASKALLDRNLPRSGRDYQKALFRFRGVLYPANVRYRGDLYYHWGTWQKSWRVKLRKGHLVAGMRRLNLINPEVSMINDHVIYLLAGRLGLAAPYSEMVQLRLNNANFGVVHLLEQVEEEFARKRGWLPGNMYAGEGIYIDLARYAHDPDKVVVWRSTDNWRKAADLDSTRPDDTADLAALLKLVREAADERFSREIWDLVDRDAFLRFHALSLLVNAPHTDNYHNWKLYFDPASGLAVPIPWDLSGLRWVPGSPLGARRAFSTLHARVMRNPRYLADLSALLRELFQAGITRELVELIDREAEEVRPHVLADPVKDKISAAGNLPQSVRDFDDAIVEMKRVAAVSSLTLWRDVDGEKPAIAVAPQGAGAVDLTITVRSLGGAVFAGLDLEVRGAASCQLFENGGGERPEELLAEVVRDPRGWPSPRLKRRLPPATRSIEDELRPPGNLSVTVDDILVPARYSFTVACDDPEAVFTRVEPVLLHGVTGARLTASTPPTPHPSAELIRQLMDGGSYPEVSYPEPPQPRPSRSSSPDRPAPLEEVVLSGEVRVTEDRFFGPGVVVRIEPGARLRLGAGVSVVVRGRLVAEGTAAAPIVIERLDDGPWGALVLWRTHGRNILAHGRLRGGSEAWLSGRRYSGMLSAYAADLTLRDSVLRASAGEDMLNIKSGKFLIEDSLFLDASFDAIDFDRAHGEMRRSLVWRAGNDGVDFGASTGMLVGSAVAACGDKAVSVGEASDVVLRDTLLLTSVQGIAVKDESRVVLEGCVLAGHHEGLASFRKNLRYAGPGRGRLERCLVARNGAALRIERGSDFTFTACEFDRRVDARSATVPYMDPDGRALKVLPEDLDRVIFDSCSILPGSVTAALSERIFERHAMATRWAELGVGDIIRKLAFEADP